MKDLSGKTVIVVGASRGLGHGIALAFREAGANVVAVARTEAQFPAVTGNARAIRTERADATDAAVAARLLEEHRPDIVVLVAGAIPHMAPLQQQTWESFSVNWQTDVRVAFHWLREILLNPLKSGSRVVVISSGAAVGGSPISGGYAGAKATQRFITGYAQDEARRANLGITLTAILPRFSPETGVGAPAVAAYAARAGQSRDEFLRSFVQSSGPLVTPEIAGSVLVDLVAEDAANVSPAYLLTGDGLKKLP